MIEPKRIGNLKFCKATYLGEEPKHPSWDIVYFYKNNYYGRDNEYPEDPSDSNFRLDTKYPNFRIHKGCFKHKECCFTIASFTYVSNEPCWELHFCGNRPIENLNTPELRETFWKLVQYGDTQLRENNYDS